MSSICLFSCPKRSARLLAMCASLAVVAPASAVYNGPDNIHLPDKGYTGLFTLDGSFVHNVGELQLHVTNWGLIGSRPSTNARYADAPSAMWPAGSGVDYLWAAGIWVGAVKNGVPLCTTGQFAPELLANPDDPLDTIYEMKEGEPGGARYPDPSDDDDDDGIANEDPKNLVDDDGDGLIDEDFRAVGSQHFRSKMRDNTALATEINPEHDPLDIEVVQESFQWENESVDDFVGFEFQVTNLGPNRLNSVYLGFFADCDIGPRSGTGIAEDDLTFYANVPVRAADGSIVPIAVGAMYDADLDDGQTNGFFGILFLNHPTAPIGPLQVGITSFQAFTGTQPFDKGGDPTNDAERYDLLSRKNEIDAVPPLYEEGKASDYRILLASGPFRRLEAGESLTFQAAMVIGDGPFGLLRNAAEAALTYYGAYFDRDGTAGTGIKGRETLACKDDYPAGELERADGSTCFNTVSTLFCRTQDCADSVDIAEGSVQPIKEEDLLLFTGNEFYSCGANKLGIWLNDDCPFEERRRPDAGIECKDEAPGVDPSDLAGCTGVEGKETHVTWLVGLAPVSPHMRLWQADGRVHVFWDNISQIVPDVRLQQVDFESYRLWRADGWDRPFGSSVDNGPESRLWRLIAEYDVVSYFEERRLVNNQQIVRQLPLGSNTGLDVVGYTPKILRAGTPDAARVAELSELIGRIVAENTYLTATIDPAALVRYLGIDGQVSTLGALYPQLEEWQCCPADIDTLYWSYTGVKWFEHVDTSVHNGINYFYAVTATDFNADVVGGNLVPIGPGLVGDPQSNFEYAVPRSRSQTAAERDALGHNIYVVPNPATRSALAEFSQLKPNSDDPTGVRVMFANLPAARNTIKIFTLSGDLVQTIMHDGTNGDGSAFWNLVSVRGQEVVSGIFLYSVESSGAGEFDRVVGRFVIIR